MYNNETVRRREREGTEGGWTKGAEVRRRARQKGESFMSPEFERPPFHVSIVIFCLFSFH